MDYHCNLCRTRTPHTTVLSHWDNNYYVDKRIYSLIRCHRCGLVEVETKPTAAELRRYYRHDYYAYDTANNIFFRLKAAVASLVRSLPRPVARRLLLDQLYAFAPASQDSSVLDIGCGDGSALRTMKALGFTKLHGTEIDPGRRSVLESEGIEVTVTSDITKARLPNASFDVVRLSHVLEHVLNPSETLHRCWSLLKDSGTLLIAVPNFDSPARRLFGRYFCGLQLPTHLYHFNKSTLEQMLRSRRFIVEQLYTVGYSGFASSLITLLKDKYEVVVPNPIATALILMLAPLDVLFNVMGSGYIVIAAAGKSSTAAKKPHATDAAE